MSRVSFEVISCVRDTLDADLVKRNITADQYAEAICDVMLKLGWTEDEFEAEVDKRWSSNDLS